MALSMEEWPGAQENGRPAKSFRSYLDELCHLRGRRRAPSWLPGHGRNEEVDDLFVSGIRRFQGRSKRNGNFVHAIGGPWGADARDRRREVNAGEPARMRHLRIEHDG